MASELFQAKLCELAWVIQLVYWIGVIQGKLLHLLSLLLSDVLDLPLELLYLLFGVFILFGEIGSQVLQILLVGIVFTLVLGVLNIYQKPRDYQVGRMVLNIYPVGNEVYQLLSS